MKSRVLAAYAAIAYAEHIQEGALKLAVIGSRSFNNYAWLEQCLLRSFGVADIEAVISGGPGELMPWPPALPIATACRSSP